jgi:hypothetical protein
MGVMGWVTEAKGILNFDSQF